MKNEDLQKMRNRLTERIKEYKEKHKKEKDYYNK